MKYLLLINFLLSVQLLAMDEADTCIHQLRVIQEYLGEEVGQGERFKKYRAGVAARVKYLSEKERAKYKIVIKNGKFYTSSGELVISPPPQKLFDPFLGTSEWAEARALYVLDLDKNLYLSFEGEYGVFHHSTFTAGAPVLMAGEMSIRDGKLVMINRISNHYRPPIAHLDFMVAYLQDKGVQMDSVLVNTEIIE
ncbi:MAG: hypothetical protein ISR65_17665 [Bacteriovoracaceae bacterium]|nr:hypothetical protein [Bacteriovoracaceae bacterium]